MKYRLLLEARFDVDEPIPDTIKFGEKAIDDFMAELTSKVPGGPMSAPFLKLSLEKVEE